MTVANEVHEGSAISQILQLCDGPVTQMSEGGRNFIFMPGLRFYAQGRDMKMDALLCLNHVNPTYPTKLYLAEKVESRLNWNETAYLFGRSWHTFSWSNVSPNQSVFEILAAHLAPLSQEAK